MTANLEYFNNYLFCLLRHILTAGGGMNSVLALSYSTDGHPTERNRDRE